MADAVVAVLPHADVGDLAAVGLGMSSNISLTSISTIPAAGGK